MYLDLDNDVAKSITHMTPQIARFMGHMGPTWVLSAPDGPHLAPWTLLSGTTSVDTIHPTIYAHGSRFVVSCCGSVALDFTLKGYLADTKVIRVP